MQSLQIDIAFEQCQCLRQWRSARPSLRPCNQLSMNTLQVPGSLKKSLMRNSRKCVSFTTKYCFLRRYTRSRIPLGSIWGFRGQHKKTLLIGLVAHRYHSNRIYTKMVTATVSRFFSLSHPSFQRKSLPIHLLLMPLSLHNLRTLRLNSLP